MKRTLLRVVVICTILLGSVRGHADARAVCDRIGKGQFTGLVPVEDTLHFVFSHLPGLPSPRMPPGSPASAPPADPCQQGRRTAIVACRP